MKWLVSLNRFLLVVFARITDIMMMIIETKYSAIPSYDSSLPGYQRILCAVHQADGRLQWFVDYSSSKYDSKG